MSESIATPVVLTDKPQRFPQLGAIADVVLSSPQCNYNLSQLIHISGEIAKAKGWDDLTPEMFFAWLHRELGEAFELLLKGHPMSEVWTKPDGKPEGYYAELADVWILMGHLIHASGPDGINQFLTVLQAKLRYNAGRPTKHGRNLEATEIGRPLTEWPAIRGQYARTEK